MPEIGDSLGRYTLLKRLAAGGMGEVYLAAKPGPVGFGPRVALKVLRDQLASDQQFIDMLVDEANISMFLNHQNVVSVLDLSEDAGVYYIAMEFVQGMTVEGLLEKLIGQGRKLDIPIALYIASELCRALKYAHTRVNHTGEPLNIIHRDVTPANILLSTQGEVKLTDFGIARAKGRIHQTQAGVLKGKFGYMAPEMIRYEAIDARADLFCAGVVIYLMITGKHPVAGATVMEAIQRYEDKQIAKPSVVHPEIPSTLDTIVMRALEPKPDQRWASAAALGAALQDAVLKNPNWRREAQDGASRLADLMREISPEVFVDPLPAGEIDRLLKHALGDAVVMAPLPVPKTSIPHTDSAAETKLPTGPRAPVRRDMSGPVTDRAAEALVASNTYGSTTSEAPMPLVVSSSQPHMNGNGNGVAKAKVTNPELETEDGLALADVFAAREQLMREMPQSKQVSLKKRSRPTGDMIPDVIEPGADEIPTGLSPAESTMALETHGKEESTGVSFPDSSTDRHRMLLEEPALPSKVERTKKELYDWEGRADPAESTASEANEATVAGFQYDPNERPDRPTPSADDGRTVVGMYALSPSEPSMVRSSPLDTDENRAVISSDFSEPELPDLPEIGSESVDDGKTLMGVAMPDFGEIEKAKKPVVLARDEPKKDVEATRAYAVADVIQAAAKKRASDEDAETIIPLGHEEGAWDTQRDPNDQTLLDGMDSRQIHEALAKQQQQKKSTSTRDQKVTSARDFKPTQSELNMDKLVADSLQTGAHPVPQTMASTEGSGPALFQGPVRIQFNTEGTPVLGSAEAANAAAAALAATSSSAEPARKKNAPVLREKKRASDPPASALSQQEQQQHDLSVGANTGKWIAGELDPNKLDWSDDAAARRAVAARNKGPGPSRGTNVGQSPIVSSLPPQQQQMSQPGVRYTPYPQQQYASAAPRQGAIAKNWTVIIALVAAVLAVAVVGAVLMFTNILWPKLRLESDPPGATVIVDGLQVGGTAPVTVKVEPERSHTIEFRLDGHRPERREITDGVGRGRTYALQVSLRRITPVLDLGPVNGTVFVNGKEAGRGTRVSLTDLPVDQPVRLRVEADGYRAYEVSFDRGSQVPESIDIPMTAVPPPPPVQEKPKKGR
jgi:serine/threonine protein kinase